MNKWYIGSLKNVKPLYEAPRCPTEDLRKLTEEQLNTLQWAKDFMNKYEKKQYTG